MFFLCQVLSRAHWWFDLSFWMNIVEVCALCGVTYVSNRENYRKSWITLIMYLLTCLFLAVHEKIFIIFMFSSLTHMLSSIKSLEYIKRTNRSNLEVTNRLFIKQVLFATSLLSTAGLVIFFLKHRLLCHDMGKLLI